MGESDHPAFVPPDNLFLHLTSRGDRVVGMWMQLKRWCVSCGWVLQRNSVGCDVASILCKYDLKKGDLFVLNWERVRRVMRVSISSELLMCGAGVHSILLLHLVARCLETIDVCICRLFVFMSFVVTVWGSVDMLVV